MKIAFIIYGYGQYARGVGRYGWYLTHELRKLGVEIDVFTANIHIRKMGPLLYSFKNLFRKWQHYDIIHSNEGAGLFVSHPVMVETYHHDYAQEQSLGYYFFSALENLQCHRVKHIIVPSYASKNSLLRYGFPPKKISVIYHGVDNEIFKVDRLARDRIRSKLGLSKYFTVINVGRFVKHKGQVNLVKAMEKIPESVLILVGKGNEENRVYETVSKTGVKMLHFKDISDESLANLYNAADVYAHTSTLEGFGLTILEAMACGLPIIAYRTADLDQIVGNAGYLTNVGDIEGIRSALWLLYKNYDVRKEMGKNAIDRSKGFLWSETAKKHAQVYKNVLHQVWKEA